VEFKTGDVFAAGPDKPLSSKNTGKSDYRPYSVNLKKVKARRRPRARSRKRPRQIPRKPSLNVLLENDAVRVYEVRVPAGAEAANVARPYRIGRALQGADNAAHLCRRQTENTVWKTGDG